MEPQIRSNFDPRMFLSKVGEGKTIRDYRKGQVIFAQGDRAETVFYLLKGRVKLTVISSRGKEAVVAMLDAGAFLGEGCLAGQLVRMSTAAATSGCSTMQIEKVAMMRVIGSEISFSELFMTHLLCRNIRIEEDLVDQLFNSSEKRLARVLLLLANFGKEGRPEPVIPKISQETLAEMVGTTRSRVSFFMNRFRRLGFIDYNGKLEVHSSLLTVLLHE
jgi:CRP/FNR family transcriptional regulator, cyclic AMP receptor protein